MDLTVCIPCYNRSKMEWRDGVLYPFPETVDSLVAAVAHAGIEAEINVADYGSTDWPLEEWLPARAQGLPVRIIHSDGPFSIGGGKNLAAAEATAFRLFFLDCDMIVPFGLIERGLEIACKGGGYFPLYQREKWPGGPLYWGAGSGCCIVQKEHWFRNRWKVGIGWAVASEDTVFAHWFMVNGRYCREVAEGFVHKWHPLDPTKVAAGAKLTGASV